MTSKQNIKISRVEFEKIFHSYYKQLCHVAKLYVKDMDVAEDVVQEVFTKFWFRLKKTNIHSSVKAYLFIAVKNGCLDYLYQNKKFNSNVDIDNAKDVDMNTALQFEPDVENNINAAIQELPKRCKDIFILSRIEGYKHKEIAEKLDIAEKTVEVQIRKASIILRDKLKDYAPLLALWCLLN